MAQGIRKTKENYHRMSTPLKATLWFAVCNILQRGISMITTPIFTRVLPTEEYGLYSTYLAWENVLILLVSLSLYKSMMNLFIKYDDYEQVCATVCCLELLITGTWMVLGILFRDVISRILKISPTLVCCLFVYFTFQSVFQCWALYKKYVYDYKKMVLATLVISVGSALLSALAVVIVSATAEVRAISSTFILAIVGCVLYFSILIKAKSIYNKKIWKFALWFCIPLLPHYLSEFILQSSDKIMINYMCGERDVAIYSVAYSVGTLITLVTSSINATFAPFQYQKIKSGEYKLLAIRANQVFLFIGMALSLIMLFCREIVLIFGGKKYEESIGVIIPICLGVFFNYMFQMFARVQEFFERRYTVVIPSILCAILNLVSNLYFIRLYGFVAAAYTTFGCYLFFCIIHYVFYLKVCNECLANKRIYDLRILSIMSIGLIIVGCIAGIVNRVLWIKYGFLMLAALFMVIFRNKITMLIKTMFSVFNEQQSL